MKKFINYNSNNMNKEKISRKDYYFNHFKRNISKLNFSKNKSFPNLVFKKSKLINNKRKKITAIISVYNWQKFLGFLNQNNFEILLIIFIYFRFI